MFRSISILALGLSAGATLYAQLPPVPPPLQPGRVVSITPDNPHAGFVANASIHVLSAEFGVSSKPVKGAPYTGEAVTETTQTLADGNRIVHKSTATLARDSEGRTRREQSIDAVGPWAAGDKPNPMIFINDPVADTSYILESNTKTAHKMNGSQTEGPVVLPDAVHAAGFAKGMAEASAQAGDVMYVKQSAISANEEAQTEALGTKMIGGVMAEGKRITHTIPAGQIGNERPLTILNETWYSPELQMVVMSKHTDPQMGETAYTVNNIQRTEPDPSLFTVPADYTITDGPTVMKFEKRTK